MPRVEAIRVSELFKMRNAHWAQPFSQKHRQVPSQACFVS